MVYQLVQPALELGSCRHVDLAFHVNHRKI
jgi:hypothetical protein